jgi:hypothetical protein
MYRVYYTITYKLVLSYLDRRYEIKATYYLYTPL